MILPGVGGSLILFILTFGVPLTVMSSLHKPTCSRARQNCFDTIECKASSALLSRYFTATAGLPGGSPNRGEIQFKRVEKDSNLQQLCMLSTLQCVSVYHVV